MVSHPFSVSSDRRPSKRAAAQSVPSSAMVDRAVRYLALVTTGVMAGFFFAFSVLVMPGLDRTDAPTAVASMQAINATVDSVVFKAAFAATPILCLAVMALAGLRRTGWLAVVGALVYLVGVLGVTVIVNVPLNDDLDLVSPSSAGAAAAWADYMTDWSRWNHVRTLTGIASFAMIGASLLRGGRLGRGSGGAAA